MCKKILRIKGVTASVPGDITTEGNIYVSKFVDGEAIFGKLEDAEQFTIKQLWDIQHQYNQTHKLQLEDITLPGQMEKDISYICDIKGFDVVTNSVGQQDNLKFIIGAHINKENKNTAIMKYTIAMFDGMADKLRETYDDYSTAVDRYNQLSIEWCADLGKFAHLSK